jgi:hypothetical protein
MPVNDPMAPIAILLLLQDPANVLSPKMPVVPAHNAATPTITDGGVFTVTDFIATQPVGMVYVISAVPKDNGVTMPDSVPIDTTVLVVVHTPPAVESVRVMGAPHKIGAPVIACNAFTVIVAIAGQPEEFV